MWFKSNLSDEAKSEYLRSDRRWIEENWETLALSKFAAFIQTAVYEDCAQVCDEVSQDFIYQYAETKNDVYWNKALGAEECADEFRKIIKDD